MWHSQFLCSTHHNKDTETPIAPENGTRHVLFTIKYRAIVCQKNKTKQNIESLFKDHIGKFEDLVLISTKIEHYLVEFLLIFFILKMRFKNLLLCCKFLKSVLKTGETETKTIYN